jgi:hypothetical protein
MTIPKPVKSQIEINIPASLGNFVAIGAGANNKTAQLAMVNLFGLHRLAGKVVTHLITDPTDLYWDNDVVTMWWYEDHPDHPLNVGNEDIRPTAAIEVMTDEAFQEFLKVPGFADRLNLLVGDNSKFIANGELDGWRYFVAKWKNAPDTYMHVAPEGVCLYEAVAQAFAKVIIK